MAGSTTRARYRMGESEDFTWNSEGEHILFKWKFWLRLLAPQVHRSEAGTRSEANDVLQNS